MVNNFINLNSTDFFRTNDIIAPLIVEYNVRREFITSGRVELARRLKDYKNLLNDHLEVHCDIS